MKFKIILPILVISCFVMLLSSFSEGGKKLKPPSKFVYIPSGTLLTQNKLKISVKSFYMQESEVSNLDYNEFLNDLKANSKTEDYETAKRKAENWSRFRPLSYGEPFVETYHKHPAFDEYPVFTISKKGAELYCKWLTKNWQKKYSKHQINFRLPTEHEWVYAAKGGYDYAPYPWGTHYYRNDDGYILANFKRLNGGNIKYNKETKKYEVIDADVTSGMRMPSPVLSFIPNKYGLYNMSGNAAEMISTPQNRTKGGSYNSTGYHIQIEAEDEYEGWTEPSPFIGFRPVMDVEPIVAN